MQCVLNLAFQYFIIYLLLWIYYTIEDLSGVELTMLATAKDALESAKATVQFAPMLSVQSSRYSFVRNPRYSCGQI